jgi:hypothetical protein
MHSSGKSGSHIAGCSRHCWHEQPWQQQLSGIASHVPGLLERVAHCQQHRQQLAMHSSNDGAGASNLSSSRHQALQAMCMALERKLRIVSIGSS